MVRGDRVGWVRSHGQGLERVEGQGRKKRGLRVFYLTLGGFHMAVAVRITRVSGAASTGRQVVRHTAVRIGATGTWTGIATLLLLARPVGRAVRVTDALRTTRLIRVTKMIGQALAGPNAVSFAAHSI